MAINIGRFTFQGPFASAAHLQDRAGVYAILTFNSRTRRYVVIDVGESAAVKARILAHERAPCWRANAVSGVYVAVYYTIGLHQAGRMTVEQELRRVFRPTCGVR